MNEKKIGKGRKQYHSEQPQDVNQSILINTEKNKIVKGRKPHHNIIDDLLNEGLIIWTELIVRAYFRVL